MKAITQYINESWTDGQLDKSVKTAERKKVYNAIYKKLEASGVTGHLYHDSYWEGVREVKKVCNEVLDELNAKAEGFKYDISIAPDEGGYKKSKDGMSRWKQYKVEVYKVPAKYEDYPEPFMLGTLNCHAAGSMQDPFDAYDISFCISY